MDESGCHNSSSEFESSDDEIYTNAVARLKALEKKRKLRTKKIEAASFVSTDLPIPIEIADADEIEEVKELDPEPIIFEKITERNEIPEVDASNSSDSSSESITDVHEGNSANQTHCVASIVLDPDDNDESIVDIPGNDLSGTENYSIEVKVFWRSYKVVRVDMCMYEPFQKAFDYFANLEDVPAEQILLLRNDKPVKPTDTPASLGISVIDIIEGGVMDTQYVDDRNKAAYDYDEDVCKIKVQHSQKESILVSLQKSHPFKFAILQCATKLNVPDTKVKLYLDGDLISPNDTPESLDLENEACIDLKIL